MPSSPGRPKGSSPTKAEDDKRLLAAAELLVRNQASTPTAAIKQVLVDGNPADLRRLQRRWSQDQETFMAMAREPFEYERWEKEAQALKAAAPALYEKYYSFARSEGGKEYLRNLSGGQKPLHFMSLGPLPPE